MDQELKLFIDKQRGVFGCGKDLFSIKDMWHTSIHDNKDFYYVYSGDCYLFMIENKELVRKIYSPVMGIKKVT